MPRAYVCADSKIYEASQWYICQVPKTIACFRHFLKRLFGTFFLGRFDMFLFELLEGNEMSSKHPQAELPCERECDSCKTRNKWFFRAKRKPENAKHKPG